MDGRRKLVLQVNDMTTGQRGSDNGLMCVSMWANSYWRQRHTAAKQTTSAPNSAQSRAEYNIKSVTSVKFFYVENNLVTKMRVYPLMLEMVTS